MSFTEQVKNELARVVRPDKESRSGELLALLRMGGAIVTGAQGKKGVEFSTGNSAVARRVLVCLKKDFNLMPSAVVRCRWIRCPAAAGTEAAQEKCVYFDRPSVSRQLAVPWGNGIGSAHGYP